MIGKFIEENKILKKYYAIKEVASALEIPEHQIRKWEKSFNCLKPKRTKGKKARQYSEKDIDVLRKIKRLVKQERYTIEGAQIKLKQIMKEPFR